MVLLMTLRSYLCSDAMLSRGVDLVQLGCSVTIRHLRMTTSRKEVLARGIVTGLACMILSITLVSATHFVPQGSRQVITVDHQIRRVLLRAQRENLRSGISVQTDSVSQHLGEVRVSEIVIVPRIVSLDPQNL